MTTYNVTVEYVTTVDMDEDHDDEAGIKQEVLDEIDSNRDNYFWSIEKVSDAV